ncbi:cytochrome c biogenesis CcdA family protein [Selenihalanaerobacter shriftii]|uniref:Cytochrome c-type biogenesis protein n=1 Tax=Selenihalanaerobacter shriftii TaxID=142842 RepID=A0A1T4PEA0_9FIRM|nr:cytochrome c biogenesis protein CcdA [Selenihalanaerobacter shriftii]SJZ89799.1 cytochrome c-type biogenesis protein [Selenihalanaerobacter shriftii]
MENIIPENASYLLIFFGGLGSGLSPCTLPTVALVVGYVGGFSKKNQFYSFGLSLAFVLGLSLTMAVMGVAAGVVGNLLADYKIIDYSVALITILMGTVLLDLVPIELPGIKNIESNYKGVLGAFLLGVPFAITASPCTAPVTATLLSYAAVKSNPLYGAILMFVYAIGRSIPLLLAGTFTGFLKKVQSFESLNLVIKKISGTILLILGFYLWWNAI